MVTAIVPYVEPTGGAIPHLVESIFAEYRFTLVLTSREIEFMGDGWAYDRGTYSMTMQPRGAENPAERPPPADDADTDVGNYLVIRRKAG